jgi:hypothetical protein
LGARFRLVGDVGSHLTSELDHQPRRRVGIHEHTFKAGDQRHVVRDVGLVDARTHEDPDRAAVG